MSQVPHRATVLTALAAGLVATACTATTTATTARHRQPSSPARRAVTTTTPAAGTGAYGDLRLGFIPAAPAARPVRPPLAVALLIRPAHGSAQTTWMTASAPAVQGYQFHLTLPPGRYRVQLVSLDNAHLSPHPFAAPAGGPAFTVPPTGCAYIGMISIVYYRLPPGTVAQQETVAAQLARGKAAYFTYLKTGGLLPDTASITLPPPGQRPPGSRACSTRKARF